MFSLKIPTNTVQGAEPLYLHVLRPLIKPYVTTLDWSLDLTSLVGDFLLLVATLPYNLFMEWWKPPVTDTSTQEAPATSARQQEPRPKVVRSRNPSGSEITPSNSTAVRSRSSRQSAGTKISQNGARGVSRASSAAKQNGHSRVGSENPLKGKPKVVYFEIVNQYTITN